ncbi:hypothetical protein A4G20_01790 [Pasteurellaceae bacterium RH1A]|nr:hypothetical protein A4G20_01790 [Pasteurellaceae bacterium RH1A]
MSKDFDLKREELTNEIQEILRSAEELFSDKSESTAEELEKLKAKLNRNIKKAKGQFASLQDNAVETTKQAVKQTDAYVQDNPYKAIGVAGVVGLLLGVLISKR